MAANSVLDDRLANEIQRLSDRVDQLGRELREQQALLARMKVWQASLANGNATTAHVEELFERFGLK